MKQVKQVIVVRRDLKMSPGKLASQVAHASLMAIMACGNVIKNTSPNGDILKYEFNLNLQHHPALEYWLCQGPFTKVVLGVDSEAELLELHEKLFSLKKNIPPVIVDNGKTEFNGVPTATCFALPPFVAEEIDKFTGHLSTY